MTFLLVYFYLTNLKEQEMTDNIDDLLAMVRARLGQDRFREALRGLLEQEDRRLDDEIVNAHLDAVVRNH